MTTANEAELRAIEELRIVSCRLETGRRTGIWLMYFPLIVLVFALVLILSTVAARALGQAATNPLLDRIAGIAGIAIFLSIPLGIFGAAIRAFAAWRLTKAMAATDIENAPPWPEIAPGELVGAWRVTEIPKGGLLLRHESIPRTLFLIGSGVASIYALALPVAVIALAAFGKIALLPSLLFFIVAIIKGAFAQFWFRRTTIEIGGDGAGFHMRTTRPYFFPDRMLDAPLETIDSLDAPPKVRFDFGNGAGYELLGFSRNALGRWQARRMARQVAVCLGLDLMPAQS